MALNHTVDPIIVGASVIAIKYADGILMCTDTLASFGSMARYKNIPRMAAIGNSTLIGASGEYSDFQEIIRLLREKEQEDFIQHDNISLSAAHYASYLSSILYGKRNKGNPLYNSVAIAGIINGQQYLAYLDLYGTHVLADYVTTGFAAHLCKPLLGNDWRPDLTESEAKQLVEGCMRTLWYRDARASNRIQFAKVTREGITFEDPYVLQSEWGYDSYKTYSLNPLYA
ncbi:unnamed protein product [Blepharisma stoltei]|uniref:Proteasome subunit beta n=1 Tax=Blepharisma stoltei TaxID=1481888 RepID=A0AAU9K7D9_9CILI|nr:unnamed protein product [Blepharisma stoltei]